MLDRFFSFVGGNAGSWRIIRMDAVVGESLPKVEHLEIVPGMVSPGRAGWVLRGVTSNERYVTREEQRELKARQEGLARTSSTLAALIPIRKNEEWWGLAQDERRKIFEEQSGHVKIGMQFLPGVARRLHHCRDLGLDEPFDFLTWFEYAPKDAAAFEDLVGELRASFEWNFVSREIDIRLERIDA